MLDSGFTGGLAVHFHDSDFAAEITGFFYFLGIRFDIPKITMTVVPSSYEDISQSCTGGCQGSGDQRTCKPLFGTVQTSSSRLPRSG